jgi:hypothetical protein
MRIQQTDSNATPLLPLGSEFLKQVSALPLILASSLLVGTGGSATAETLDVRPRTGTAAVIFRFPSSCGRRREQTPFLLPQEQMAGIRRYLSLNISELAKVLLVERPTVYSWLKGEAVPRSGNSDRIAKIYSIAHEWRAMSSEPIKNMLNMKYGDDTTLLTILSEQTIDEVAARRVLARYREALNRVPRQKSVAEIAKQRGIQIEMRELSKTSSDDEQFNL